MVSPSPPSPPPAHPSPERNDCNESNPASPIHGGGSPPCFTGIISPGDWDNNGSVHQENGVSPDMMLNDDDRHHSNLGDDTTRSHEGAEDGRSVTAVLSTCRSSGPNVPPRDERPFLAAAVDAIDHHEDEYTADHEDEEMTTGITADLDASRSNHQRQHEASFEEGEQCNAGSDEERHGSEGAVSYPHNRQHQRRVQKEREVYDEGEEHSQPQGQPQQDQPSLAGPRPINTALLGDVEQRGESSTTRTRMFGNTNNYGDGVGHLHSGIPETAFGGKTCDGSNPGRDEGDHVSRRGGQLHAAIYASGATNRSVSSLSENNGDERDHVVIHSKSNGPGETEQAGADSGEESGDDDEDGRAQKHERKQRQEYYQRMITDGFRTISGSYVQANHSIREIETNQKNMLGAETEIWEDLVKFGARVREATALMQRQINAAFDGSSKGPSAAVGHRGRRNTDSTNGAYARQQMTKPNEVGSLGGHRSALHRREKGNDGNAGRKHDTFAAKRGGGGAGADNNSCDGDNRPVADRGSVHPSRPTAVVMGHADRGGRLMDSSSDDNIGHSGDTTTSRHFNVRGGRGSEQVGLGGGENSGNVGLHPQHDNSDTFGYSRDEEEEKQFGLAERQETVDLGGGSNGSGREMTERGEMDDVNDVRNREVGSPNDESHSQQSQPLLEHTTSLGAGGGRGEPGKSGRYHPRDKVADEAAAEDKNDWRSASHITSGGGGGVGGSMSAVKRPRWNSALGASGSTRHGGVRGLGAPSLFSANTVRQGQGGTATHSDWARH